MFVPNSNQFVFVCTNTIMCCNNSKGKESRKSVSPLLVDYYTLHQLCTVFIIFPFEFFFSRNSFSIRFCLFAIASCKLCWIQNYSEADNSFFCFVLLRFAVLAFERSLLHYNNVLSRTIANADANPHFFFSFRLVVFERKQLNFLPKYAHRQEMFTTLIFWCISVYHTKV